MELASSSGTTLQGPSSLSSREIINESNDFVVINGHGNSNSYDEPDIDPFTSLSQADAVAQVKELLHQRDYLQSNFAECTQTLSDVTQKCKTLKEQEQEKCNKAKKRIGDLMEVQILYKEEIDKLTQDLAKYKMNSTIPTLQEASPGSEQLPLTMEEDNSQSASDTAVEYCTSTPITLQGFSASSTSSIRETEVDELKNQVQMLQDEKRDHNRRLRETQEDAQEQVQRIETKRQTAERQCAAISTQFHKFRHDKDLELAAISFNTNALKANNRDLESQLHSQAVEFDSSQREILGGLRKKCLELESTIADQNQRNADAQRDWQNKEQKILARCRELDASKTQIASEQSRSNDLLAELRSEKQKSDGIIAMLKPIISECGKNIQRLQAENGGYKLENGGYKLENEELNTKVEQLNRRIEDLNQSVGEEVPALIARCDDWKEKLKAEKAASERQRAELQDLQSAYDKYKTDIERERRHVQKLNCNITALKQENAKYEGIVSTLNKEIGELNSNNIQLGRATTQPALAPRQLSPTPEDDPNETGDKYIAAGYSQPCPFASCTKVGDSQFLSNHIERDH